MGVLNCSRKGCDEIMCQTYIPTIGYLCYSCKSEFKEESVLSGEDELTENEFIQKLEIFVKRRKSLGSDVIEIDDFFGRYRT